MSVGIQLHYSSNETCHYMEMISTLQALSDGWFSPHKGAAMQSFDVIFAATLNKLWNKQLSSWWFEASWHSQDTKVNTLTLRQNGHHFPHDMFKCIFLNENVWISIKISLKFVPMGPFNNIPTLVTIMAWCRTGNKPLSESMMDILLMHICITQPQWVKTNRQTAILS